MVRKNKYTHTRQYWIDKKQEAEKLLVEVEHRLLAPLSIHDAVKVEEILKDAYIRFSNDVTVEGKRVLERNQDSKRAKRLLGLADELLKKPYGDALKNINYELLANGQLTSRQLLFLMAEFKGIDTSSMAKVLGKNGGEGKKGHKCELYYAVKKVTEIINSYKYIDVARYLNKQTDQTIEAITVISSNLPDQIGLDGILEYQTSKGKQNSIKSTGISVHIRNIRKVKNI